MPIFLETKEPVFFVPEGDYIFCVTDFKFKFSQGAATSGAEQYEFTCEVEGKNSHYFETLTAHSKTLWHLESFLRCCGQQFAKGAGWSFVKSEAEANAGWKWINPLGLRGHVHLIVDEYNGKKRNKVGVYYANKGVLTRRMIEAPKEDDDIPFQ